MNDNHTSETEDDNLCAHSYGVPKIRSTVSRTLTEEEREKLQKQDTRIVSPFIAAKAEENAQKHWDQFYKRNTTRFFKDRHWTTLEFKEFLGLHLDGLSMLEVGCGVGNLLFPLIQESPNLRAFACDFSPRAVEFVKGHTLYNQRDVKAFQADITCSDLREMMNCQVDIATIVFVLSAIEPTKFVTSLKTIFDCLKAGGIVLFRDYAINDMTQIRFKPGCKIADNLYIRQDGTRTYFFSTDELSALASAAGFIEIECFYIHSRTINKKKEIDVPRVFIQAKFKKP